MKKFNFYKTIIKKKFVELGVRESIAESVSDSLVLATSRGIHSHGINLVHHYGRSVLTGRKNPNPNFKIHQKYLSSKSLDADHTFGASAGYFAIENIINEVKKFGISSIGVYNSSHCASLSSIALQAVSKGMIFIGFTHANPLMKSPDSKKILFGTNPICIAAPTENKSYPICLDMATTKITWNKLKNFKDQKINLTNNIACDSNGDITLDPYSVKSLLPIGGYKGFALAGMIDFLCGPLNGMKFGTDLKDMYEFRMDKVRALGQFYICMMPDINLKLEDYYKKTSDFIGMIKEDEHMFYPGEKENIYEQNSKENGIYLNNVEKKSLSDFLKLKS